MTTTLALEQCNRLVGTWITAAIHPAVPDLVVHGTVVIEWLERRALPDPSRPHRASGLPGLDFHRRVHRARSRRPRAGQRSRGSQRVPLVYALLRLTGWLPRL